MKLIGVDGAESASAMQDASHEPPPPTEPAYDGT